MWNHKVCLEYHLITISLAHDQANINSSCNLVYSTAVPVAYPLLIIAQVPNKKKQDPRARAIGSLGRKIHQRHLPVNSETGENMVTMHRVDVLRLMDENGSTRLMTGKHIHEEQLKLGEKQKAKTGPVQVKELTFSSDIGNHDLLTKLRQVQNWLDKKHRVRITLRTGCMEHVQCYSPFCCFKDAVEMIELYQNDMFQ
uniref:Mitochondrial translational initiation factor 3 n=1 Tax=Salmo trutta TaxID=8032 RepID=A0A674EHR0_SALTR